MYLQVDFVGVTGKVSFDDAGYRNNFKLDVLELGLNSEPKKVSKVGDIFLLVTVVICVNLLLSPLSPE